MQNIQLRDTTGNHDADTIVRYIVLLFEAVFPDRIAGYYVEGSFATHTAVFSSDLDLIIVFRDQFIDDRERDTALQISATCAATSRLEADLLIIDENSMRHGTDPMFVFGTRCVYGIDQRATTPLVPILAWARKRMHAAFWLIINVFRRQRAQLPLTYPDPSAQFLGYTDRPIRLASGQAEPSTRDLVRVVGWSATALVAHLARQYVGAKRDCAAIYRQTINDRWAEFVEDLLTACRAIWQYRIPTEQSDRQRLRELCERTLAFENHFLQIYREFLAQELSQGDIIAVQEALALLNQTFFDDVSIVRAVERLTRHHDPDVRRSAASALRLSGHTQQ